MAFTITERCIYYARRTTGNCMLLQMVMLSFVQAASITTTPTTLKMNPRPFNSDHLAARQQQVNMRNLPDPTTFPLNIWAPYANLSRPVHCEFNALHPCDFTVFHHWSFNRSLREFAQLMRQAADAAASAAFTGNGSQKDNPNGNGREQGYNTKYTSSDTAASSHHIHPATVPEVNYYPCSSAPNRPSDIDSLSLSTDDDDSVLAVHIPWPKFFPLPVPIIAGDIYRSTSPSSPYRRSLSTEGDVNLQSAYTTSPVVCLHVDVLFMDNSASGKLNITFSSVQQWLQVQLKAYIGHASHPAQPILARSSFDASTDDETADLVAGIHHLPVNKWLHLHVPVFPELFPLPPDSSNPSSSSNNHGTFGNSFINHGQKWFTTTSPSSLFQLTGCNVCIDNVQLRSLKPSTSSASIPPCLLSISWVDSSGARRQALLNSDGSLRVPSINVNNRMDRRFNGDNWTRPSSSWFSVLFSSSIHNSSSFGWLNAFSELVVSFPINIGSLLLAVVLAMIFFLFVLVIFSSCARSTRPRHWRRNNNNPIFANSNAPIGSNHRRSDDNDQDALFRQSLLMESVHPTLKFSSLALNEALDEHQIPTPSAPPAEDTSTDHSFCFDDPTNQHDLTSAAEVTNSDIASIQLARNFRYFQKNRAARRSNKLQSSSSETQNLTSSTADSPPCQRLQHLPSFVNPLALPLSQQYSCGPTGGGRDKSTVPPNWRCSRMLSINDANELIILSADNRASAVHGISEADLANPTLENTSRQSTVDDSRFVSSTTSTRLPNPEFVRAEMAASITALIDAAATRERTTVVPSSQIDTYNSVDRFQLEDEEGPPSYRDSVCASPPFFNHP